LNEAIRRLEEQGIGAARLSAEVLLMQVLGRDRAFLLAHPEQPLTEREAQEFGDLIGQRASGRPLQYITGHQEFYGLDFMVTPAVLIPRPETEHLVEAALEIIRAEGMKAPKLLDVGTGSGCIALAVAHELKKSGAKAEVHAVDISQEALDVATLNAERLQLTGAVKFHQGDLLAPVEEQSGMFDLVLSNPPYVGRNEQDKVQREVREHEPNVAVFAGEQGLDVYRRLIPQAARVLKPGGWLLLEIGYSIEREVRGLLGPEWTLLRTVPDLQGIPRVVVAQRAS